MKKIILFGLVFLILLSSAFATINDATVSYSFDDVDTSGTTAYDTSGTNQHGTINGATTGVAGLVDSAEAYDFDGTNDNVNIGDIDFSGSNKASVSVWVNFDSTVITGDIISDRTADDATGRSIELIHLNNRIFGRLGFTDGTNCDTYPTNTFTAGSWHHFVFTWDGTTAIIYLDGTNIKSTTCGSKTLGATTNPFLVGERSGARWFDGQVDQVMVWNDRALSSTEVTDLYNSGAGDNPYPPFSGGASPSSYFTVTTQDDETFTPLTNISVTLSNGSVYQNTSSWVQLPFNDSSLQNFTVSLFGSETGNASYYQGTNTIYWNKTYTNWNTSFALVSNHTQYPYMNITNAWTNESIFPEVFTLGTSYYCDSMYGFCDGLLIYRDGLNYAPFNSTSQYVEVTASNYFNHNQYWTSLNSNDINISMQQSVIRFGATQIITGNSVTPANFTIDGVTKGANDPFYLAVGDYNVTFSKYGYNDKTKEITINATNQKTITVENVGSTIFGVIPRTIFGNSSIQSFTATINNTNYSFSETIVSTNGFAGFTVAVGVPITLVIDNASYALYTELYTPTGTRNETYYLYTTNSIYAKFYDSDTNSLITSTNVSADFISDYFAVNRTTNNGTIYVDLMTPTNYIIRANADGYNEGYYYAVVEERGNQTLNIYLENASNVQDVTITIIDERANELENALIRVQKYFPATGTYTQVGIVTTNTFGEATYPMELNSEYYKFIIEYPSGTVKKITSPTYITSTTLTIPIQLQGSVAENFFRLNDITSTLTFNNATNNFRFEYLDSGNNVDQACMYIYRKDLYNNVLINETCNSGTSGTLLRYVPTVNGTTYMAKTYVKYVGSDEMVFVQELTHTFSESTLNRTYAIFLLAILTIVFALLGAYSITIAAIITPLPLLLASLSGLVNFNPSIAIAIQLLGIILAVVVSRR